MHSIASKIGTGSFKNVQEFTDLHGANIDQTNMRLKLRRCQIRLKRVIGIEKISFYTVVEVILLNLSWQLQLIWLWVNQLTKVRSFRRVHIIWPVHRSWQSTETSIQTTIMDHVRQQTAEVRTGSLLIWVNHTNSLTLLWQAPMGGVSLLFWLLQLLYQINDSVSCKHYFIICIHCKVYRISK